MKTILTAIGVVASFTAATMVYAQDSDSIDEPTAPAARSLALAPPQRELVALPDPGYIHYSESGLAPLAPGCEWVRMPTYDSERHVVGWRGDPVGVCP